MAGVYDKAEILMSLLVLGGAHVIPDHGGILDRALAEFSQTLPAPLQLTFSTTGVGFRCFELPDILFACQETGMVEWETGDMRILRIKLPLDQASEIAFTNHSIVAYQKIGQELVVAIEKINMERSAISPLH
jgi:hypothetical protein